MESIFSAPDFGKLSSWSKKSAGLKSRLRSSRVWGRRCMGGIEWPSLRARQARNKRCGGKSFTSGCGKTPGRASGVVSYM